MSGTVKDLFHYPIKGLSAQTLSTVSLSPGQGFPLDRAFGFARPGSGFDPDNPRPLPKSRFMVLAQIAELALLDTHYDASTDRLIIGQGDAQVGFPIATAQGQQAAAAHLAQFLTLEPEQYPTLHAAAPHRFTDVSVVSPSLMNAVSLINLDSVTAFGELIGQQVDPARFRGNLLFSGVSPFAELEWIGQEITIGEVRLKAVMRTKRCPATQVNLQTAKRDLDIPALLRHNLGHSDMGIYCEVLSQGNITIGDPVQLVR